MRWVNQHPPMSNRRLRRHNRPNPNTVDDLTRAPNLSYINRNVKTIAPHTKPCSGENVKDSRGFTTQKNERTSKDSRGQLTIDRPGWRAEPHPCRERGWSGWSGWRPRWATSPAARTAAPLLSSPAPTGAQSRPRMRPCSTSPHLPHLRSPSTMRCGPGMPWTCMWSRPSHSRLIQTRGPDIEAAYIFRFDEPENVNKRKLVSLFSKFVENM